MKASMRLRSWRRLTLRAARRASLAQAGAVVALVGPVAMVVAGYGWEGGLLALASGLAAAILSRLKDLAEVGAWGFSAKLRQAEELAQKAAVTAEELRRLALPIARMSLGMAIGGGRMGGHTGLRQRTRDHVEHLLRTIEATEEERREAYVEWRAWEHIDAAGIVYRRIYDAVNAALPPNTSQPSEMLHLHHRMIDVDRLTIATPEAWRNVAETLGALTAPVWEALAALESAAANDPRPEKHHGMPRPDPQ
jgi:hypothetical protein